MKKREACENYNLADTILKIMKAYLEAPKEVQDLALKVFEAPKEEKAEITERIMKSRKIECSRTKEGMC